MNQQTYKPVRVTIMTGIEVKETLCGDPLSLEKAQRVIAEDKVEQASVRTKDQKITWELVSITGKTPNAEIQAILANMGF